MTSSVFEFDVYYDDTDAGGVMYHANYLKYAEHARTNFLKNIGFSNTYFLNSEKPVGFVVRQASLTYIQPAKLEDRVTVETNVKEMTGATILFEQIFKKGETVLVTADILVACVNAKIRPTRLPQELREKISDCLS